MVARREGYYIYIYICCRSLKFIGSETQIKCNKGSRIKTNICKLICAFWEYVRVIKINISSFRILYSYSFANELLTNMKSVFD